MRFYKVNYDQAFKGKLMFSETFLEIKFVPKRKSD